MVEVYRRSQSPKRAVEVSAAHRKPPSKAPGTAVLEEQNAALRREVERQKALNAELQRQLDDERSGARFKRLEAKVSKAHRYAQSAKAAASHWFTEAHRLADGRPIRHRSSPCTECGLVEVPG